MSENDLITAPEETPKKAISSKPSDLTRISKRRAGRIVDNPKNAAKPFSLEVWRLRKPNKDNKQFARDIQRSLNFATREQADVALLVEIQNAENRANKETDL